MITKNFHGNDNTINLIKQHISRDLAKFSKNMNGKGPTNVEVEITNDSVLCIFEGFMTRAEEVIVQSGCPENVSINRVIYVNESIDEINEIFYKYLHRNIKYLFPCYMPQKQIACWTVILD